MAKPFNGHFQNKMQKFTLGVTLNSNNGKRM